MIAALADCHRDATPVWIAAVNSCLDEGRVDDCLGDALGLRRVQCPIDVYFDQRVRAFAIAGDLLGEIDSHVVERSFELRGIDRSGGAGGHHDRGVAGRGVGIDADAVEGPVNDASERGVEFVSIDGGVGEEQ